MVFGDKGTYKTEGSKRDELAAEMVDNFRRYSSTKEPQVLKNKFLNIIEKAVDIAKLFTRSESRYVLLLSEGDKDELPFVPKINEAWTDVDSPGPNGGRKVDLVVSPALLKLSLSSTSGDRQWKCKVLHKACVCVQSG